jgi:ssDNA-binding Zn-finger/Zn-ribbon topoisomerase 1
VHDCPKCNYHEIINWSRYCPWCGRRVKWDNAEELLEDEQYVEALKKVEGAVVRLFKRLINKGEDK